MNDNMTYLRHLSSGSDYVELLDLSGALHHPDSYNFHVTGRFGDRVGGAIGLSESKTSDDAWRGFYLGGADGVLRRRVDHEVVGRLDSDGRIYAYLGESGADSIFEEVALVDGGDMVLVRGVGDNPGVYQENTAVSDLLRVRRVLEDFPDLGRDELVAKLEDATGKTDDIRAAMALSEASN
ncbi:MAG: hypothetical protein QF824_00820 [Candidatus Woesearchaeota archaeon]|nr:hypothetical protein [Candidatus Woesearchaeota archaeon]